MEKSEYLQLLKHPKWQKKRLTILKRDNFQCQLCKDKETTLHIHHLKYIDENKPWEYKDKDLITLCEDCHKLVEEHIKDGKPICIPNCRVLKFSNNKYNSIIFFIIESGNLEIYLDRLLDSIDFDLTCTKRLSNFLNNG